MGDTKGVLEPPESSRPDTDVDELVVEIAEAVASAGDADPTARDLRLGEQIDLDALASMYAHASDRPDSTWTVTFDVEGSTVTVDSDGQVTVS